MTNRERRRLQQQLWLMVGIWVLLLASLANAAEGSELPAPQAPASQVVAPQAVIVTLKPSTTIDRADVRLSDVFEGFDPALDRAIARAPAPGRKVTYDVNVLTRTASLYRLPWRARSFSDAITFTRASTVIDTTMVNAAIVNELRAQNVEGDIDVQLDQRQFRIDLPTDASADFTIAGLEFDAASRRFNANLLVPAQDGQMTPYVLRGRAIVRLEVPVLTRPMNMGEVITAADVTTMTVPADRANGIMKDPGILVGKSTRRNLMANTPLRTGDVAEPKVVVRGALVTILVTTSAMQLTAQGRAMQDGAVGDVIRVVNTQSNRPLQASVTGDNTVRIVVTQTHPAQLPEKPTLPVAGAQMPAPFATLPKPQAARLPPATLPKPQTQSLSPITGMAPVLASALQVEQVMTKISPLAEAPAVEDEPATADLPDVGAPVLLTASDVLPPEGVKP